MILWFGKLGLTKHEHVIGIVPQSRLGVHLTRTLVHLRVDTLEAFYVPTALLRCSGLKTYVR